MTFSGCIFSKHVVLIPCKIFNKSSVLGLLETVFKKLFLKGRVATLGSRISEEIMQVEVGRILELEEEIQHHCQKIASLKAQASSQVRVLDHFLEQLL